MTTVCVFLRYCVVARECLEVEREKTTVVLQSLRFKFRTRVALEIVNKRFVLPIESVIDRSIEFSKEGRGGGDRYV